MGSWRRSGGGVRLCPSALVFKGCMQKGAFGFLSQSKGPSFVGVVFLV